MFDEQGLLAAIRDVASGRCQRTCAPGKWRVWRDDGGRVKIEVMA